MAEQCRRLPSRPAHDLEEFFGHAPMVSGRTPARLRLARGRELGPVRRRRRRRNTPTTDGGALRGRNRDLVRGRPLHLLPLGSHWPLRDLEGPARRRAGSPDDAGGRLLRGGVRGRSIPLLLQVVGFGNLACAPLRWRRVGSSEGARGLGGLGPCPARALLRDVARSGPAGVHDPVPGLRLRPCDTALSERTRCPWRCRWSRVSGRFPR